jgi:DNA-binding winged helix-turn-helix (wHTH) protein
MSDSGGDWIYRFDDVLVVPHAHRLERAGKEIAVEPKAYAVLVTLLEQAGDVVDKDALLDAAWRHRHVTPSVLSRVVAQLRHALDDSASEPRYIATVHSLGYRFIGNVQRCAAHPAPEESESATANATVAAIPSTQAKAAVASATPAPTGQSTDRRAALDRRTAPPPASRRRTAHRWGLIFLLMLALVLLLLVPPLLHP